MVNLRVLGAGGLGLVAASATLAAAAGNLPAPPRVVSYIAPVSDLVECASALDQAAKGSAGYPKGYYPIP